MLNKQPIFINAFARGGSNIIMNLLLSHPNVCLSDGETHKVFKGTKWNSFLRKTQKLLFYDSVIRLISQQNYFSPKLLEERKQLPAFLTSYVDKILYKGRFRACRETHNKFKFKNIPYKKDELARCRLLTKALNGLVFTMPMFYDLYPDATFFGLIRNGLAICEGYIRRGGNAHRSAEIYASVVNKMLNLAENIPTYHIVYYEDMVADPLTFTKKLYKLANLNLSDLSKIRLQSKPIMDKDGQHQLKIGADRQVFWYKPAELNKHVRPDLNDNQIKLLSKKDKETFLSIAGPTMEKIGYNILTEEATT